MEVLTLPKDLLGEIIKYLPSRQCGRLSATSKILNEIVWTYVTVISAANIDKIPLRHMKALERLDIGQLRANPKLLTLTRLKWLNFTFDVSSEEERNMLKQMTHLHELCLKPRGATTLDLAPILEDHSRLTLLMYSPVDTVSSTLYSVRIEGLHVLTRLKCLSIQFSTELTDDDLLPIMDLTSLTSLEFTWLDLMTGKTIQHLTRLSNLDRLELVHASSLEDKDYTVLQHLTKLTFLDLSYTTIESNMLESIATLTLLTTLLILEENANATRNMQGLTNLTNLQNLTFVIKQPTQLNLAVFNHLRDVVINSSANIVELVNIPTLQKLRVEDSSFNKVDVEQGLCKLTQISTLELTAVKSFDIEVFGQHCSNLTNLLHVQFFPSSIHKPQTSVDLFCRALCQISSLRSLKIYEIPPNSWHLKKLTQLSVLYIAHKSNERSLPFSVELV